MEEFFDVSPCNYWLNPQLSAPFIRKKKPASLWVGTQEGKCQIGHKKSRQKWPQILHLSGAKLGCGRWGRISESLTGILETPDRRDKFQLRPRPRSSWSPWTGTASRASSDLDHLPSLPPCHRSRDRRHQAPPPPRPHCS